MYRFPGEAFDDGRLVSAACERNRDPILAVLEVTLPRDGLILEIGSGTGEHVAHFAKALPRLVWQPSDRDGAAHASIVAWARHYGVDNVRTPIELDVCRVPWPVAHVDAVVCINVIHIAPWAVAEALLAGAAQILVDGGVLFMYGPYRRHGRHTAPSNEEFDARLRASDPEWGVRDLELLAERAAGVQLQLAKVVEMPRDNLSVVFRKTGAP